jgi:hypothetical protein
MRGCAGWRRGRRGLAILSCRGACSRATRGHPGRLALRPRAPDCFCALTRRCPRAVKACPAVGRPAFEIGSEPSLLNPGSFFAPLRDGVSSDDGCEDGLARESGDVGVGGDSSGLDVVDPARDRADHLGIDVCWLGVLERAGWTGSVEEEVVGLRELHRGDVLASVEAFEPDVEVVVDGDLVVAVSL